MITGADTGRRAAQRVALSAISLVGARAVQFALSLWVIIVLARYLSPIDYGDYIFVVSLTSALIVFCDFGLVKIAVREIAREPSSESGVVGTVILARLLIGVIVAVGAQLVLVATGMRDELRIALAIACTAFVAEALLTLLVSFQVRIDMQFEALTSLVSNLIQTGGVLWLISHSGTLYEIVALPTAGRMVAAIMAAIIAWARYRVTFRVELARLLPLFVASVPVGIVLAIAFLSIKLGGIMLGFMATPEDVARYGVSAKLVEYLIIGAALVLNPAYPLLAAWHGANPSRFQALYERVLTVLLLGTPPIPITLACLGGPLVALLYPPEYASTVPAFQLIGLALTFMVINAWHGLVLIAAGRQRVSLLYDAVALGVNVAVNVALIPRLGYMGTAWATLAAAGVTVVCSTLAIWYAGVRFTRVPLARLALALAVWATLLWVSVSVGIPAAPALVITVAGYGLVVLLLGVVDRSELRVLLPGGSVAPAPVAHVEAL